MQNKSDSFLLLVLGSSQRVHVIWRKANICSGASTLTLFLSGANGRNYPAPPSPCPPKRCRRIGAWRLLVKQNGPSTLLMPGSVCPSPPGSRLPALVTG
jgi:hypothetical protein